MERQRQKKFDILMTELSSTDKTTTLKTPPLVFIDRGVIPYQLMWDEQKKLQQDLIAGAEHQTVIFCEHPPVITLGKAAVAENVLVDKKILVEKGVELFPIERGGDVTYHGPGQLVVYPILNLNFYRRDVGWYMRNLEEIIISVLDDFGIKGQQIEGKTGVWINNRKIASIGVRFSRWCSMHGLALNVLDNLSGFDLINPCGFTDISMTSVATENSSLLTAPLMVQVKASMKKNILSRFGEIS